MKRASQTVLILLSAVLLAACDLMPPKEVPIIERSVPAEARTPAPAPEEPPKEDPPGMYTVRKGDTLIHIALDHGLNYRDIAAWNGLANVNDIKVGQVLRMKAPDGPVPVVAPPPEVVKAAPPPRKTGPRGDKKPYSDSAVAEMQRADNGAPAPARPERAETPAPAAAQPGIAPGATVTASDDERLSWMWPSDGRIIATFDGDKNKGVDIGGKAGQQVVAAGAGKVMYAGSGIRGYGNLVIVKHSNNLLSAYAHNRTILVKEGQTVAKGQVIAEMGDSDADSVKLHFEIRHQGKPVDPTRFLPAR
jgi:lipoprotein NlpD